MTLSLPGNEVEAFFYFLPRWTIGKLVVQVLCELPESYEAYRKQQHSGILVLCIFFGSAFQILFLPRKELALAFLLLVAVARSLLPPQGIHFYFLLFRGISFLIVGMDLIGKQGTFQPGSEFDQLHTEDSVPKLHDGKTTGAAYEDGGQSNIMLSSTFDEASLKTSFQTQEVK
eukprot:Gb_03179 [translate_table: standard]